MAKYGNDYYRYDDVSFTIRRIYDNSYSFTDITFDTKITINYLYKKIKDEILNNPNKYPDLYKFLKVSEIKGTSINEMVDNYIDIYLGRTGYYDEKDNLLEWNEFSVKVRYFNNGKKESLEVEDIYYPDNPDMEDIRFFADDYVGEDPRVIDKFVEAMPEFIDAFWEVATREIKEAVEKYFIDVVSDTIYEYVPLVEEEEEYEEEYEEEEEYEVEEEDIDEDEDDFDDIRGIDYNEDNKIKPMR